MYNYEKIDGVPCRASEGVVLIEGKWHVAISCSTALSGDFMQFHAVARAINDEGRPILDSMGSPIESEFIHSQAVAMLDDVTANDIARDCLLLVTGNEVPRWGSRAVMGASIVPKLSAMSLSLPANASDLI